MPSGDGVAGLSPRSGLAIVGSVNSFIHPPRSGRRRRRPAAADAAAGKGKAGAAEVKVGGRRREGKVFDLFIWGLGKPIALDVTVVHPLAPSNVQKSADNPESLLKKAEAEKHGL